jgi:leucyl-tRNA synthetase
MALEVKEEVFVQDSILYMVMIGGKKRTEIEVNPNASQDEILSAAKEAGARWLEGMQIVKEIVVPNKLVNLAVKPS